MTNIAINQVNVKCAYIDYLQTLPWTFFITGSTRYELTLKSVRRLMERWYDCLIPDSRLFWVAEKFELKDGYHAHGLLYIPFYNETIFPKLIDYWQLMTGNKVVGNDNGKIEWDKTKWNALNLQHYDPKRGAGGYCAKYVFKSNADYDFLTC